MLKIETIAKKFKIFWSRVCMGIGRYMPANSNQMYDENQRRNVGS